MTTILRITLTAFLLALVSACDSKEEPDYVFPFPPGVELKVKAFGHFYWLEAVKADGAYVTWKVRWNERVVLLRKVYKGLISVYETEAERTFVNEFDTAAIDSLFPLASGNETSFKGTRILKEEGTETPFWAHIAIRKEEMIKVRDKEYRTFVIDITTEFERAEGTVTVSRTLWFSPELGFGLKSEYRSDSEQFGTRVLAIALPNEPEQDRERRRNNLGTVRI